MTRVPGREDLYPFMKTHLLIKPGPPKVIFLRLIDNKLVRDFIHICKTSSSRTSASVW